MERTIMTNPPDLGRVKKLAIQGAMDPDRREHFAASAMAIVDAPPDSTVNITLVGGEAV